MKGEDIVLAVAVAIVITVLIAGLNSQGKRFKTLRTEAVEHGYAEWVTDSSGNSAWQWKELPE